MSGDVLEQLDVLNGSFKAQPDYLRLLSNMSLGREERARHSGQDPAGTGTPLCAEFLQDPSAKRGFCMNSPTA